MKIKKRRPITLLEIMITIFIIGIIGSVLAYNMRGSLEEGRAYKSEQGSRQVHDFLSLAIAEGKSVEEAIQFPERILNTYGYINDPKKLLKDGWSKAYTIEKTPEGGLVVHSETWQKYLIQKKQKTYEELEEEYPWAFYFTENHLVSGAKVSDEEEIVHSD